LDAEGRKLPVVRGGHHRRADRLRYLGWYCTLNVLRKYSSVPLTGSRGPVRLSGS
jgi:hypothetical protein